MSSTVIIQSRLGSQRLPAKALLPLANLPSVVLCAKRAMNQRHSVRIACSLADEDQWIIESLQRHHVPFFRGSEENVLSRLNVATQDLPSDEIIVRLTADNPMVDGELIAECVAYFQNYQLDFLTTTFVGAKLPYGMSVEIFHLSLLRQAHKVVNSDYDKEHVTTWIRRIAKNMAEFTPSWAENLPASSLRCTLDTYQDYIQLANVFNSISNPITCSYRELIERLARGSPTATKQFPSHHRCGQRQSDFTLGTAQLGMHYGRANQTGLPTTKQAVEIIQRSVEYGVRAIDTARAYGLAESRIKTALKKCYQAHPTIITKCDPLAWLHEEDEKESVIAAINASIYQSCHELGRECLAVVLLHRAQHLHQNNQVLWQQLCNLQQKGVIGALGVSVNNLNEAIQAAQRPQITYIQLPLNIMDHRWFCSDWLTVLKQRPDLIIHARSTLLQGILATDLQYWPMVVGVNNREQIKKMDYLVEKFQRKNRADLCYAYVRGVSWVTSCVVGIETLAQLHENLDLFQSPALSAQEIEQAQAYLHPVSETLLQPSLW